MTSVGRAEGYVLVSVLPSALAWTGFTAVSPGTWLLKVVWVLLGLPVVVLLRKRFPLNRAGGRGAGWRC